MNTILKSKIVSFSIISSLLLFLFQGIFKTYAFTDGYEFIWNSADPNSFITFIQQGRAFSGGIITSVFPSIQHISDYSYLRTFNLLCLFVSVLIMYKILVRNTVEHYYALLIVIFFITAPYSSIIVHWEATSSCIWALPMALITGEIIFTTLLNKEILSKSKFYSLLLIGIGLGVLSLFTYQPAFTAAIFPAFIHFLMHEKRKFIWQFICIYFVIFILYFVIFQLQLSILNIPANERAGIAVDSNKLIWFLKGAFIKSFQFSFVIGNAGIINAIRWAAGIVIAFYIFKKYKNKSIPNPFAYVIMLLLFYVLAYFPSFIATDTWISFRTMSAIAMLSSTLFMFSISYLPIKKIMIDSMLGAIAISFIALAFCNNNTFTDIAAKEYRLVKETIAEKLNYSYPDSIAIIMPEENFLVTHNIVSNVVTDEIGKLSTSVDWAAKTLPLQLIYELTNDKAKAKKIKMNVYKRAQLPLDSILQKDGWLLDIEKIYLTK